MTQETAYELVLKAIAALELTDKTFHVQKLQLCNAPARGVLDLKPGGSLCVFLGTRHPCLASSTRLSWYTGCFGTNAWITKLRVIPRESVHPECAS